MSWNGWRDLALLGLAGALGALARHGMNTALGMIGGPFPWGIFAVNILGCGLFGLVWELGAVRGLFSDAVRVILLTGFAGAFTTFSTLVFDIHAMLHGGRWFLAAVNLCGQILLGFAALRLGMAFARF